MKKIGIYVCGDVSNRCTANGCMRVFNAKEDSFNRYKNKEIQLVAFNNCSGCENKPIESLDIKIEKLKKAEVNTIHVSTCIRGRCINYEKIVEKFAKYFDVIGYTHGSKDGKKDNTINMSKKSSTSV